MSEQSYTYIIVGGGLTGASAVEGIRAVDRVGSILLLGQEKYLPYDRPPLSKKLWFGKLNVSDIFLHSEKFYREAGVELAFGATVTGLDVDRRLVMDAAGNSYGYEKLLLATGGQPRRLSIPGGDLEGLLYYRYLDDYVSARQQVTDGQSAVVIGGGFIGSEMAAALNLSKAAVTMIYPDPGLVSRVFPEGLGRALQDRYAERGITMLSGDRPASIERRRAKFVTRTQNGQEIESDLVVVGIGIAPAVDLARSAGLAVGDGIVVNEYLQTSRPGIFAAGDNAFFPYSALGQSVRIEHWDNAINQGQHAGRHMAGGDEPFTYMPYFFSDLFEFGYEAVGEVDSRLETVADWQKENDTGVIYYRKDSRVRGAMMCNVWDKVEAARDLIRQGKKLSPEDLRGAIR